MIHRRSRVSSLCLGLALCLALPVLGCVGSAGPEGPPGKQGPPGPAGPQGPAGKAGGTWLQDLPVLRAGETRQFVLAWDGAAAEGAEAAFTGCLPGLGLSSKPRVLQVLPGRVVLELSASTGGPTGPLDCGDLAFSGAVVKGPLLRLLR